MNSNKKILFLGNGYPSVFGLRGELVEALVRSGHEVTVSFSNGVFGKGDEVASRYGCKFIDIPISRRTAKIYQELKLLRRYYKLMKDEKPDIVLAYTVKCDVYGGIAARMTGTPFIANITGIGKGLDEAGIIQKVLIRLYKLALRNSKMVYFQNEHDKNFFLRNNITFTACKVIPGSGVNLEKFQPLDYPNDKPVKFLYVSRVMRPKGIDEFLETARFIRRKYPDSEFHVCGYCEEYGRGGGTTEILSPTKKTGAI